MSPYQTKLDRRGFLKQTAAGIGAASLIGRESFAADSDAAPAIARRSYDGPNVIMIRFGGGVRRRETINPDHTYSPYFLHTLCPRGTLFSNMEIEQLEGVETSHGQGTLYLLTGIYDRYKDVDGRFLGQRFEAKVPTLFEYFRKHYAIPEHQTLIINGEDRTDEEFYSFSNHHLFGVDYRSNVLSLYRFKVYLLRRQIERENMGDKELAKKRQELDKLESLDYRVTDPGAQSPKVIEFWERWRRFYGESGFVNPRGDRLLTELAVRAVKELRPKLMLINFNDPDYVHWGNPTHYTRGIQIIDQGINRIVECVDADDEYRDNTVFVIVPDCGRDANRAMAVPFQHHFNSKSAHEIFALFMGPGIARGEVVDSSVQQISVASTLGRCMKMPTEHTQGPVLDPVFA